MAGKVVLFFRKKLTKCSGKMGQTPGRTHSNLWKEGSDPW
jgi:hypothetical protein